MQRRGLLVNLIWYDAVRSRTVNQNIDNGAITRTGHRNRKVKERELIRPLIENNDLLHSPQNGKHKEGTGIFDSSFQMISDSADSETWASSHPPSSFFYLSAGIN